MIKIIVPRNIISVYSLAKVMLLVVLPIIPKRLSEKNKPTNVINKEIKNAYIKE